MVLMIMRAPADGAKLEELAKRDPNPFEQIRNHALEVGGIRRHRIYATETEVIVVDEWDHPEDFESFVQSEDIQKVFAELGVSQPDVLFARQLDLGDDIG